MAFLAGALTGVLFVGLSAFLLAGWFLAVGKPYLDPDGQ